ncbi:hypothetical protein TRVL_07026 [Trypanosoma vivax]|uniref:Uncharacterized protein n=1 Tax=Trypanosoma vivax (strain Y486) TaxID=1055687 RepID=G0TWD2_TRYVY|nr:hypothetical protein TRVL_07026 [Trypanosoma vivax]CCC48270.1 hypothetical protein TVY486_0600610 [Trypanosoma vivax Y486]
MSDPCVFVTGLVLVYLLKLGWVLSRSFRARRRSPDNAFQHAASCSHRMHPLWAWRGIAPIVALDGTSGDAQPAKTTRLLSMANMSNALLATCIALWIDRFSVRGGHQAETPPLRRPPWPSHPTSLLLKQSPYSFPFLHLFVVLRVRGCLLKVASLCLCAPLCGVVHAYVVSYRPRSGHNVYSPLAEDCAVLVL